MERRATLWFGLSLGLGAAIMAFTLGGLFFPVDDAYIHFRYAVMAAAGHPFAYAPGEPLTTGATSLLWPLFLLLGALPARLLGDGFLAVWALLGQGLAVGLTFTLLWRTTRAHGVPVAAGVIPAVICLLAPVWFLGVFNGMETALYGLGLAGAVWVLSGGHPGWLLVTAATRPEGALIALVVVAVRTGTDRLAGHRGLALGVVAVAALSLSWPRLLTGEPAAAWSAKALWTEPHPEHRHVHLLRAPYHALQALWFGLSGARPLTPWSQLADWFTPGALPGWLWTLFLGGGVVQGFRFRHGRAAGFLWIAASLTAITAITWTAQHYRYVTPAYPLLAAAAVTGWFARAGDSSGWFRRGAGFALLAAAIAASLAAPPGFRNRLVQLYRGDCERMHYTQWAVGETIDRELPPEARVATHDVGAIAYRGRRPVVDLVGLVTPELEAANRHGQGAMWEGLAALPPERRPSHAAIIPAWMPHLYRSLLFDQNILTGSAHRDASSQEFEVWSLQWPDGDVDRESLPAHHGVNAGQHALEVVDSVDLANLADEARHHWVQDQAPWRGTRDDLTLVRDLGFGGGLPRDAHVIEGGRELRGAARVQLAARDGQTAVVVFRTSSGVPARVRVRVGSWQDSLRVERGETIFGEPYTVIPSEIVSINRSPEGMLELEIGAGPCTLYRVWLLQPEIVDQSR